MIGGNYVYVICYGERDHKIGFSIRPRRRLSQLQCTDLRLRLVRTWHREYGDAQAIESVAHCLVRQWRHDLGGERERFDLSAAAACLAVELAIQIVDDGTVPYVRPPTPVEAPRVVVVTQRGAPLEQYGPPAEMAPEMYGPPEPPQPLKIGYVQRSVPKALERDKDILISTGVEPGRIYSEIGLQPGRAFLNAVKACRNGDTLVIVQPKHITDDLHARLQVKGAKLMRAAA